MNTREITNQYLAYVNNWCDGASASKEFWSTYENEKAKRLNNLFGDKLIIEKDIQVEKSLDDIRDDIEEKRLSCEIRSALAGEFAEILRNYVPWASHEKTAENEAKYAIRDIISHQILSARALAHQTFQHNCEFVSPITNKVVKIQIGSKISKALKHFITDKEKLEKIQILYSQILNDKFLKGVVCLSIHPLDYLTASVNQSGWDSCYNTLSKGCWCASTLSLVTSPNTIMVYLKSKEDVNYGPVEWNNKKWRSFATLSENSELVHFGRNYPYENLNLMNVAKEMISELTGHEYGKIDCNRDVVVIETPENMYNDADCGDIYTCMTEKYEFGVPVFGREYLNISSVGAVCPTCGAYYDDCEFDIECANCGDHTVCNDCGDTVNEDDRYWIDAGSYYVCSCCIDSYTYCDECHEYHIDGDTVEYAYYWNESRQYYSTDYMCSDCAKYADDVITCPTCERLVRADVAREDGTCFCCSPIEAPEEF